MQVRRGLIAASVCAGLFATTAGTADAAKSYANCTKLNRDYPHGVGKPHARDKTSGTPVTNFKRSKALYNANPLATATGTASPARRRDSEGGACRLGEGRRFVTTGVPSRAGA
jgi:hypothetical protein